MKKLILLLFLPLICKADKIYFNNGKVIDAEILEANETHLVLQRSEDLQQFRVLTSSLTIDSRKQIELYHSEDRYSTIPQVKVPIDKITAQDFKRSLFSRTKIQCNKAVKQIHGINDTFSTGSQNQKPPQPSS